MTSVLNKFINRVHDEFEEVENRYPRLQLFLEEEAFVHGEIDIEVDGQWFARYEIKIVIPIDYPNSIPETYEVGGRIADTVDMHKFPSDRSCCLVPPAQKKIILGRNYVLLDYIEKLVVPYLANQRYFELEAKFHKEYSHGNKGIFEFYLDYFETTSADVVKSGLACAITEIGRNDPCFCGGIDHNEKPIKYKRCHLGKIRTLRTNTRKLLLRDQERVGDYINSLLCNEVDSGLSKDEE